MSFWTGLGLIVVAVVTWHGVGLLVEVLRSHWLPPEAEVPPVIEEIARAQLKILRRIHPPDEPWEKDHE